MAQNADVLNGQLPLKGVILCCTALPQDVRTGLGEAAAQMGAIHKLDLTADVTHLIVGAITTPKYKYVAKERPDIKVLPPTWLDAVREAWMEGSDVDVEALERTHRLPPFSGLHICLTGFEDIEQRNWISQTAADHGATYHGDLTKAVTHLIAAAPQGQKYTHAKRWGLSVVSLKWFEHSMERGMAVDEAFYDPTMPIDEQGVGAFKRHIRPRTSLGKHSRDGESQGTDAVRKKLRRTASTRLESQSQDMWMDMSAGNVKAAPAEHDQWSHQGDNLPVNDSIAITKPRPSAGQHGLAGQSGLPSDANALFSGCHVLTHGLEGKRLKSVRHVLLQNGATIAESTAMLEDASCAPFFKQRYLVVPHTTRSSSNGLPDVPPGTVIATEWWVERCVHYKQLLDPIDDALSQPLGYEQTPDFDLLVSTTGFTGVDLRQIAEAVKLMGAVYQEKILPSTAVLVSGVDTVRKEKAFYAHKHKIPVVSAHWMWECLKTKKRASFAKFSLPLPAIDPKDFAGDPSTSSPLPSDAASKDSERRGTRKDDSQTKRLSSSRKQHATPSLALQATSRSAALISRPSRPSKPIVHEDDDDDMTQVQDERSIAPIRTLDGHAGSQPLQELSPNLSPRKVHDGPERGHNETLTKENYVAPPSAANPPPIQTDLSAKEPTEPTEQSKPSERPAKILAADLAEILNRQIASRPSSAAPDAPQQRRKDRPLGRASSGISRSLSTSAQQHSEHTHSPSTALATAASDPTATRASHPPSVELPPSTQLGYETLEAEAHRAQMSKKMGTALRDEADLRRVPSLGVVKDTSLGAQGGIGSRNKGRNKGR